MCSGRNGGGGSTDSGSRESLRNCLLVLISGLLCVLGLEVGLRWFVMPSKDAYGTLFGHMLPPIEVIQDALLRPSVDRRTPYDHLVVDGQSITLGDLWGLHKEHPLLGYTNQENAISSNGWWQSNNLGARSRSFLPSTIPRDGRRMLVFGDSFAHGSGVRQEQAWPALLDAQRADLEVMNFGVNGYSMAQSFLYYKLIRVKARSNVVLLMFVPEADLWRDINTLRDLIYVFRVPFVLPRFVIEDGRLRLVTGEYTSRSQFIAQNTPQISPALRRHLQRYDRFYMKYEYEDIPIIGGSLLYKIATRAYYNKWVIPSILDHIMDPNSEAVRVSRAIFQAMKMEVEQDGATFVLVLLPDDIWSFAEDPAAVQQWKTMAAAICGRGMPCIDLSESFMQTPPADWDHGYDGTHYGPKANRVIATLVQEQLVNRGVLK